MWTMPRQVLQVVAVLLGLCAAGGFALGIGGSSPPTSSDGGGPTAEGPVGPVVDARPLNTDAPPPPEPELQKPTDEELEKAKAAAAAKLAAAQALAEQAPPQVILPPPPVPTPDPVGDAIEAASQAEEPPH